MSEKTAELKALMSAVMEKLSQIYEQNYAAGDRGGLFETLKMHFLLEIPVPLWAQRAFIKACQADPKAWEDVLGPLPEPMNDSVEAFFVGQKLRRERGLAIGDDLFNALANELKTSAGTAKRRYYGALPGATSAERARIITDNRKYVELLESGEVAAEDIKYLLMARALIPGLTEVLDQRQQEASQKTDED
jgi:hypothetical protein